MWRPSSELDFADEGTAREVLLKQARRKEVGPMVAGTDDKSSQKHDSIIIVYILNRINPHNIHII